MTSEREQALVTMDSERRVRLKLFLTRARSRLGPRDVGLPQIGNRRVPGLRREEVAELIGISSEWYRLLESGRSITVSARVLERLATVLGLDPFEQTILFGLALPELYRAQIIASAERPSTMPSLIAPLTALSDLEEVRHALIIERERFLTIASQEDVRRPGPTGSVRPRIFNSWRRSRELHVDASRSEAHRIIDDAASCTASQEQLLRASSDVMTHLANTLADIGYAVVLTDGNGTILDIRCERNIQRKLERIAFMSGADWSEASAGTNAIGTALTDDRPLQLMGAEHFCDGWQDLTCTAAPIHDSSGNVAGTLDVTGHYRLLRPQLLGTIMQYALEIEERLQAAAS
jgi:transcriptional regulator with XRE-family HTH domain